MKYTLLAHNTILVLTPYSYYQDVEVFFILYMLLAPVVYLMLFVKHRLGGKYDNNEYNTELSRVVFVQMAVNVMAFLWVAASFWGFVVLLSNA